jgi:hypothetical protein
MALLRLPRYDPMTMLLPCNLLLYGGGAGKSTLVSHFLSCLKKRYPSALHVRYNDMEDCMMEILSTNHDHRHKVATIVSESDDIPLTLRLNHILYLSLENVSFFSFQMKRQDWASLAHYDQMAIFGPIVSPTERRLIYERYLPPISLDHFEEILETAAKEKYTNIMLTSGHIYWYNISNDINTA